jgi:UDP:flavonoid glycosyltransferase YjiC (YdhE family)
MSRIVLTTMGSLGDLHPKIELGLGLRDRGHDVVFATHKEYRTKIESLGFEFHAMRPDNPVLDNPELMARIMNAKTGTEYVQNWLFASIRETYTDLLNISQNADFIVASEVVYPARIVAEMLGIRWAFAVLSPTSFLSAYDLPVFPIFSWLSKLRSLGLIVTGRVVDFANFITRDWGEPLHQLRQELGLPPIGNPITDGKYSPYLVLALFSPVVGAPQPDWAANTVQTGFVFYDGNSAELTPELQQFLEAGKPPIVFTLGSTAVLDPGNFYQESIKAAKQLNRRAVLLIGKNPPPKNLPEAIVAVNYAPYSAIFPYACAVVHQGGIGTTAQALRAGRPTVVMPYSHDQPDNAARVERLGTSRIILRQNYTAKRIVKELSELLDNPKYAAKASEIGRIVQAEDGVRVACDAIEQQLIT